MIHVFAFLVGRGVPNSDFCRIRIFCRIHFAESEYSAEHSALPNNEENMFNQASVQCRCSIKAQASDFVPIVRNLHYVHFCTYNNYVFTGIMEFANY